MSTYSTRLQIELIGIGDQANAWGTTTNNNFSQSLEQSIAGVYSKNLSSGTSTVLTSTNGPATQADNENRQAAIIFSGQTSNHTVQFTAKEKLYFLRNNDTTYTVTARLGASGNTYVINPSTSVFLATDGTNWFELQTTGGTWITKTGTYTALSGDKIFANTSGGAFTITLPAAPAVGDEVRFVDLASTFDTNNLTIGRNSLKINGATADLTVATEDAAFALVYSGATYGWKLMEK
jgi:hypothetical protein